MGFFYGVEDDKYTLFPLALFSLTAHLSAVVSSVNDPVSFRQRQICEETQRSNGIIDMYLLKNQAWRKTIWKDAW